MNRTTAFYKTAEGKCPVEDFLDSVPSKDAQRVLWVIQLLEEIKILPANYFRKLKGADDIWECRIRTGYSSYRVFAFFFKGNKVVLTHGYVKKSQKTDPKEIDRARRYRRDYINRFGDKP